MESAISIVKKIRHLMQAPLNYEPTNPIKADRFIVVGNHQ